SVTNSASQGNPIGHTNLAFDSYNPATHTSRIQNSIWYSTQANHCNDQSSYTISATAQVRASPVNSSNDPVLTADAGGGCVNGSAWPTQFFSGNPTYNVTQNPVTLQWEATVAVGTFIRNVQASHNNVTNANSQYWHQVENEEVFHVGQFEGTTSAIVADLWDPALVMAEVDANEPYVAPTRAGALALAQAAFATAVNNEMNRSNTITFAYPPGPGGRRCDIEREAKAAAGSSHHTTMACSYPACP
ncbi:MAG: hypothetical protein KAV87_65110, partial [Desulfobacteraceae bacterium]|nr:hypothetical protein [Desulfobacteraceae bacterium]